METTIPAARRISPYFFVIIMIVLLLSLASIYKGIQDYLNNQAADGSFYLTMGVTTLAVSTYLMFMTRKRVLKLGIVMQPLTTTLQCQKCGFKNIRDFQRGDYVFKQMDEQCPKCSEKALSIGSIFREVKEKEKAKEAG